jgi:hypothetical protein
LPGLEHLEAREVPSFAAAVNYSVASPVATAVGDFNGGGLEFGCVSGCGRAASGCR